MWHVCNLSECHPSRTAEQKIQDRLLTNPAQNGTLQELIKNEGAPGDKKRTATEGLMWLLRCVAREGRREGGALTTTTTCPPSGLDFTAQALRRSIADPSEELSVSFTKAYETSLRQYHNFVVKGAFGVGACVRGVSGTALTTAPTASCPQLAMKACPYRKDFYAKLGSPPEKVETELRKWLDALEKIVKQMQDFYVYVAVQALRSFC